MSRTFSTTPEQLAYLRANFGKQTLKSMAANLGCNVDTLKRILVRQGIANFPGAKFVPSRASQETFWTRPCMRCRDTTERPRNQYICDRCTAVISEMCD